MRMFRGFWRVMGVSLLAGVLLVMPAAPGRAFGSVRPVPGPVPNSPANRDYQPGFAAALMLKDLKLSQEAAQQAGAVTPLGAEATQLYALYSALGNGGTDFSGIIKFLRGETA